MWKTKIINLRNEWKNNCPITMPYRTYHILVYSTIYKTFVFVSYVNTRRHPGNREQDYKNIYF